jgi:hypothetical protein
VLKTVKNFLGLETFIASRLLVKLGFQNQWQYNIIICFLRFLGTWWRNWSIGKLLSLKQLMV